MVRVEPALCTNVRVEGTMADDRGGECSYDQSTGLPDAHCRFTASGPEDLVTSVMAVPDLQVNTLTLATYLPMSREKKQVFQGYRNTETGYNF